RARERLRVRSLPCSNRALLLPASGDDLDCEERDRRRAATSHCGWRQRYGRRRTGLEISEEEHLPDEAWLLLDLEPDRLVALGVRPALGDALVAARLVELDEPAGERASVDGEMPGDDDPAVLEALGLHRQADLSRNDGLALGRAGRVGVRCACRVGREDP